MQKAAKQFLLDLLSTPSPSGFEARCARVWLDYVKPFADETLTDAYGNAFAIVNPKGDPTVLLEGHSDEIGLMAAYIDEEGFIWVNAIGGIDPKMMLAKRVVVHTGDGPLPGVIGALAPHLQTAELREKSPGIADLYVDVGASSKAEVQKMVRIGDAITVDHGPVELLNGTLAARSCDNKIGIWSSAEALRRYAHGPRGQACVVAAAHVQEEVGLHGAAMGAYRFNPHAAIVVDVTNATDFPLVEKKLRSVIKMGDGPAIRIGPVAHPKVNERLEQVAAAKKIPLQRVPIPGRSGTNANSVFISRQGIPTAILSTPNRYMHSPSETIDLADLDQIPTLMAEFCKSLKRNERFTVHPGGKSH